MLEAANVLSSLDLSRPIVCFDFGESHDRHEREIGTPYHAT